MLDAAAQPTLVEANVQLPLVVATRFATQKDGNIGGFDCLNQGFQEMRIEYLQRALVLEDQICGELSLHNAPAVVTTQP
jgi:hypothetical protein